MIRRLEFLINTVRKSTDIADINTVKNNELIEYFNAGQKRIQSLIFQADSENDLFEAEELHDLVIDQQKYPLPIDIFAGTSVSGVERISGVWFTNLDKITSQERIALSGYTIMGKNLLVHPSPLGNESGGLKIKYARKAPKLDIRRGEIKSLNSATQINFKNFDEDIELYDEYFSIVDSTGTIIASNLLITSIAGTKLNFTGDATAALVGHHLVMGKLATSTSILPEECEPFLLDYVRMRVYLRDSQDQDTQNQTYFTNGTEDEIVDLFSKNDKDTKHPPLTDTDFLEY